MRQTLRSLGFLFLLLALFAWGAGIAQAHGLIIPNEKDIPPLAMLNHRVQVTIEDQVSVTKVEQTFRNHTDRALEATYVFPVPKGASVRDFAMWMNGQRVKGELLDASKAKQVYTDIVRRTQDPGLLEYLGADLLRLAIFPVPPRGDQKVELSYTSVARKDHEVVEYTYPLRTDGKATSTLEDFALNITLRSQQPIVNIYSPTHAISISRVNDREAMVRFEKNQALLDKDFQVFYTTSRQDVGLTALQHRPISTADGYFLLLISPRAELARSQQAPRDLVFVLDTSGSMREGNKIEQARRALKYCLNSLTEKDRFALIGFATTVNRYGGGLTPVNPEQLDQARKWLDRLEPTGGTAIHDALAQALELRSADASRTFTVVFFTDGKPTIGETNTDKILAGVSRKNTANTRIFTFGVGHDLNASFLDQLSEQSRAVSTFVRPEEDIEVKVSSFYDKISHPVLANLKLTAAGVGDAGERLSLLEVYPPQLPDLFHGGQLVVLGRYHGSGHATLTLTGTVGKESREFVYEADFAAKVDGKGFVEDLWARRKVGYLLDQIRLNGEKKELVDEATALAKKYGIATPYTSYLIVPDAPLPVAGARLQSPHTPAGTSFIGGAGGMGGGRGAPAPALRTAEGEVRALNEVAKELQRLPGEAAENRGKLADESLAKAAQARPDPAKDKAAYQVWQMVEQARGAKMANDQAVRLLRAGDNRATQVDRLGVDLSVGINNLKYQNQLQQSALRCVNTRNCLEIGGVWIDEAYAAKTPAVTVKCMSDAYFRILEKQPEMKEVFKLGNYLVWITPSGTALVIDQNNGQEKLSDAEIDKLFAAAK